MDNKLEVTLETVTPLFLGGSDGQPELRPPAFRGVLRYWWRALAGGALGPNWRKLKLEEDKLWGGTEKTGQVITRLPRQSTPKTDRFPLLPHRTDRGRSPTSAIRPQESFKLIFFPRPLQSSFPDIALATFMLFVTLGGIGRRSRRGFGTLRLTRINLGVDLKLSDKLQPLLIKTPQDIAQLEKYIRDLLDATHAVARESLQPPTSSLQSSIPDFPILTEPHAAVLLCKESFASWEEAMKRFWFKLRSQPYKGNEVFGTADKTRQASPLHLRVIKTEDGFHLLMTVLRSRFKKQQPDWGLMDRFLGECADTWQGVFLMGEKVRQ